MKNNIITTIMILVYLASSKIIEVPSNSSFAEAVSLRLDDLVTLNDFSDNGKILYKKEVFEVANGNISEFTPCWENKPDVQFEINDFLAIGQNKKDIQENVIYDFEKM